MKACGRCGMNFTHSLGCVEEQIEAMRQQLAEEKKGRERDREEFRKGTAAWQKKITNAEKERDALKKGLYGAHRN